LSRKLNFSSFLGLQESIVQDGLLLGVPRILGTTWNSVVSHPLATVFVNTY
jgi:hypothetical protein